MLDLSMALTLCHCSFSNSAFPSLVHSATPNATSMGGGRAPFRKRIKAVGESSHLAVCDMHCACGTKQ